MQQKIIWMRYLIFGISLLLSINSCNKDYHVEIEWVYINETDSVITTFPENNSYIKLEPKSEKVFYFNLDGDKNAQIELQRPLLRPDIIYYGATKCDTLIGKTGKEAGPKLMENYEIEKRGNNDFKCTYRFTQEMLLNAKDCN